MSTVLEIKDLHAGYRKHPDILNGVNLTIEEGEILGVIGLNGSGKSTLAKAVFNNVPYRSGEILFNGHPIMDVPCNRMTAIGISMMYQGGRVFPNLTVSENIHLAIGKRRNHSVEKRIIDILPFYGKYANSTADKLSGGERHLLAFAMCLASSPRLIIMDEPSAGLSPTAADRQYEMLKEQVKEYGLAILLVEQNIARALNNSDKMVLLSEGKAVPIPSDIGAIETQLFNRIKK